MIEINETKRKLAEKMGVIVINISGILEEQCKKLNQVCTMGYISTILECGGNEFTASLAAVLAPRGSSINLAGFSEKLASFQPLKIVREGIQIIPSIIYDHPHDCRRTIQLIWAKIISPGFILSAKYGLQQIQKAMDKTAGGKETKIVVNME